MTYGLECYDCGRTVSADDSITFIEVGNMRRLHKEVPICDECLERREMQDEWAWQEEHRGAQA